MSPDVDIKALRCFLALAQELSFGRAAERMNLTQPSLSAQIRKLEDQVGHRLFERTTRAVHLSPTGKALIEQARTFVSQADAFAAHLSAWRERPDRRMVLGAPIYTFELPEHGALLSAIARELPDMSLRVDNGFANSLVEGLIKGSVDMAMVVAAAVPHDRYLADMAGEGAGELEMPDGLQRITLSDEQIGLAIPEEHPLASYDIVPPEALSGSVIAMLAPLHGRSLYRPISVWLSAAGATGFLPPEAHAFALERYCREYRIPAISIAQFRPRETGNVVYRPAGGLNVRTELAVLRSTRKQRSSIEERLWDLASSLGR
ncbi:transcriptional regulator, LysR family [Novosphingobium aromaticivorans DSM 12444]|uniref:Transcriptional regulator, LysR family n=1 Tax=Novosphingobium aromaticivorans (strain ATCC 700278 / DSM 12444 / CCUG 56034 / CIP 105152 / NBRC 16084 / F199) TaxID=279238 RepID=Q2G5D0_NOVAD|nr:LysR family transcriptional regulator [Novosphingobium aromaticivorans]ABD26943.1 transcriptional regulator, LysR family [Novosphingobium aromaticivorans DSM 12444]SCY46111.1 transcriptional regulator, LysR family [Novosphingobium aromaticivorans]